MLNLDFYLKSSNKLDSVDPVKMERSTNTGDPFYSVLIKHQLEMIRAWSPPSGPSALDIDPFALSKALLKLKVFGAEQKFQSSINSQHVLKSYEVAKRIEDGQNLSRPSLKELSVRVAAKNSIPATLFQKLIQTESGYDPEALSPRGAMGLGQIMPETAKELGLTLDGDKTPGSVWHAESNLDASARYLKKLYDKYQMQGIAEDEAWNFAAGAYNAGMGNIAKAINKISNEPVKTWDQVAQVLPQVTGKYSQETIRYVNRLRA
ncbi:MAG: lytic transglycosylase domain-containing protein [Nitrospinae bacterium]|nr:lytic transglycosylase domain-containing protein [Nitrospinota bacterium]MBL7019436.1 lytic transglycosylase domain-containing protein [Nitrospinaceae bacterium]